MGLKNIIGTLAVASLVGCGNGQQKDKMVIHNTQELVELMKENNQNQYELNAFFCTETNAIRELNEQDAWDLVMNYHGGTLCLENVLHISPEVASTLATFKGSMLWLPSLQVTDEETIKNLSKYDGHLVVPESVKKAIRDQKDIKEI